MTFVTVFTEALSQAGDQIATMIAQVIAFLPRLVAGLIVGAIGYLIARQVRRWGRRIAAHTEAPESVEHLIVGALYVTALVIVAIVALGAMGVKVYGLVAGLGVSGLVVGFALKDIIENLLAGALILLQQPFQLGDAVTIGDISGSVVNVHIRATEIKTWENVEVVIPNRVVYNGIVKNYSTYPVRRREVSLGIGYGESLPETIQTLLDAARKVDGVVSDPAPFVSLADFGDSAVKGSLFYYMDTSQSDFAGTQNAVLAALNAAVKDASIDLPYPTQVVIKREGA